MSSHASLVAGLAAAGALALAGCGGGDTKKSTAKAPAAAATKTVSIKNFMYAPVAAQSSAGGQIRFTNADSAAHTVTADDGSFDSGTLQRGATKGITFAKAGTFAYHCAFHPYMKGKVVVS